MSLRTVFAAGVRAGVELRGLLVDKARHAVGRWLGQVPIRVQVQVNDEAPPFPAPRLFPQHVLAERKLIQNAADRLWVLVNTRDAEGSSNPISHEDRVLVDALRTTARQ